MIIGNDSVFHTSFLCAAGVPRTCSLTSLLPGTAPGTAWIQFNPLSTGVYVNLTSGVVASPSAGMYCPQIGSGAVPIYPACITAFNAYALGATTLSVTYGARENKFVGSFENK